jgi:hypothetical protein
MTMLHAAAISGLVAGGVLIAVIKKFQQPARRQFDKSQLNYTSGDNT